MDQSIKAFTELGVLVGIIVTGGFCLVLSARWIANHLLVPLVKAGVEYMNGQTEVGRKNVEMLEALRRVEEDIHSSIKQIESTHSDPDSVFATVHTNNAIVILAKAVKRVADHLDVKDVDSLITEIEVTLRKQR